MHPLPRALRGALTAVGLTALLATPALASKTDKIDELVGMHDLKTAVAIGNYYLKQRILLEVRSQLADIGKAQSLGPDWNPSNPYWKQGEDALVRSATKQVNRQFSSLEWLSEEWAQLNDHDFSEQDIDRLLAHFKSDYGRKQVMIVDHGVAVQVQGALTFTGKMVYDVPGAEEDRNVMQHAYSDEDRDMRFNIDDSPESVQFALSPVGKRYFVNAVLKVSGMITRRLEDTAASIPQTVKGFSGQAQPAVDAFRRQHEG
jgi:hypothetical protein